MLCENERAQHHVDQQTHAIFHIIFPASRNVLISLAHKNKRRARVGKESIEFQQKITHIKRSLVLVEREGRKHGQKRDTFTYEKDFLWQLAVHHSCQENDNRKKTYR